MKIRLIEHGCPEDQLPSRAHANDVGADVYALHDDIIEVGCSRAIPLGFGLDLPAGFGAFIFPRSSQSKEGIDCKLPPLDPGYTGEMHAIIHNGGHEAYHIYTQLQTREINNILRRLPGWKSSTSVDCGAPYGRQRGFIRESAIAGSTSGRTS